MEISDIPNSFEVFYFDIFDQNVNAFPYWKRKCIII